MKRVVVVAMIWAGLVSSPAVAQEGRIYSCKGPTEQFRVMIAPNEMQRFVNGAWAPNWCLPTDDIAPSCGFQGSTFVASVGGQTSFTLDTSTGAFFDAADPLDDSSSDERGACQTE